MTTSVHVAIALVLGAVFGSFSTVLVSRVPVGEGIGGRSGCRSCGSQILARDNIPVLSWLLLRGRCRHCGAAISWRYPSIELLTAVLFALVVLRELPVFVMLAWLAITPMAVALAFIDLEHKRLPDRLTFPAFAAAVLLLTVDAIAVSRWGSLRTAVISALLLCAFYLLLHLISRGGMGMGDVKLALVIGALTGYFGWEWVIVATFTAFICGSLVGVALMALRRAGRKSELPFGPFMLVGLYVSLVATEWFFNLYLAQ